MAIAGCGGGSNVTTEPPTSTVTTYSLTEKEPSFRFLSGNIVKGPVAYAEVSLYALDVSNAIFYDQSKPIAAGYSDAGAALRELRIDGSKRTPLVLVADASRATDLNTNQVPVIRTLITVIPPESLRSQQPVYVTPLTTLAFYIARENTGHNGTEENFLSALELAAESVRENIPIKVPSTTDILRSPPILTEEATSFSSQHAVSRHRAAIEYLASVLNDMSHRSGLDTEFLLKQLAIDMHADQLINGLNGNDDSITGIDPTLFAQPASAVTIPNLDLAVSDIAVLLRQDMEYLPAEITLFDEAVNLVNLQSQNAHNSGSATELIFSWDPASESVDGYLIYWGTTALTANTHIQTLSADLGDVDYTFPFATIKSSRERTFEPGEKSCFRARAFNHVGISDFSEAICTVL